MHNHFSAKQAYKVICADLSITIIALKIKISHINKYITDKQQFKCNKCYKYI